MLNDGNQTYNLLDVIICPQAIRNDGSDWLNPLFY